MSSSGHGRHRAHRRADRRLPGARRRKAACRCRQGNCGGLRVDFDYEITLLTVRSVSGTVFCQPVGHIQVDGDYRISWQPQAMSPKALDDAQRVAKAVTDALGGYGIFGVEPS